MDNQSRQRVVELMARMATGDRAAIVTLYQEFGPVIGTVMRRILREFRIEHVESEDLDGLVMDACFALYDCASGWDPQRGAQPWTWAEKRLRALVATFLDLHADELDESRHEWAEEGAASGRAEPDGLAVLDAIAASGQQAALLKAGLERVTGPRNRAITLEVKVQQAAGDPSPAVTVAQQFDMKPDAVRQVVKRTLDKLRALAASDPTFASLADLPFLA